MKLQLSCPIPVAKIINTRTSHFVLPQCYNFSPRSVSSTSQIKINKFSKPFLQQPSFLNSRCNRLFSVIHHLNQQTYYCSKNQNNEPTLTHLDPETRMPTMVDVGEKAITKRTAHAQATVFLPDAIINHFKHGDIDTPKGPVFSTAIVAGTLACKRTSELIPFCHVLPVEGCKITVNLKGNNAVIDSIVTTHHKTGVEMEALMGANITALTIYDMCKSITHGMTINAIHLVKKTGGKSDYQHHLKVDVEHSGGQN